VRGLQERYPVCCVALFAAGTACGLNHQPLRRGLRAPRRRTYVRAVPRASAAPRLRAVGLSGLGPTHTTTMTSCREPLSATGRETAERARGFRPPCPSKKHKVQQQLGVSPR
jgi:hypothetical protein